MRASERQRGAPATACVAGERNDGPWSAVQCERASASERVPSTACVAGERNERPHGDAMKLPARTLYPMRASERQRGGPSTACVAGERNESSSGGENASASAAKTVGSAFIDAVRANTIRRRPLLACLDVQVVEHLEVVGDEAARAHQQPAAPPTRQLVDDGEDVGPDPRLRRPPRRLPAIDQCAPGCSRSATASAVARLVGVGVTSGPRCAGNEWAVNRTLVLGGMSASRRRPGAGEERRTPARWPSSGCRRREAPPSAAAPARPRYSPIDSAEKWGRAPGRRAPVRPGRRGRRRPRSSAGRA